MRGHDGIIWFMCIFLCFSMPVMYKIQKTATMSELRIRMDRYLDTAIESSAYGNFEIIDGKVKWIKEKVVDCFEQEVRRMFRLEMWNFPVFLIREGGTAYFYNSGQWEAVLLDAAQPGQTLRQKMEQLLGCSDINNVFLPNGNESDYCNAISENSIFAVMYVRPSVYIVSGCCIAEAASSSVFSGVSI